MTALITAFPFFFALIRTESFFFEERAITFLFFVVHEVPAIRFTPFFLTVSFFVLPIYTVAVLADSFGFFAAWTARLFPAPPAITADAATSMSAVPLFHSFLITIPLFFLLTAVTFSHLPPYNLRYRLRHAKISCLLGIASPVPTFFSPHIPPNPSFSNFSSRISTTWAIVRLPSNTCSSAYFTR